MSKLNFAANLLLSLLSLNGLSAGDSTNDDGSLDESKNSEVLQQPQLLMADGAPIDIGQLTDIAHAGPWIADVDGDGDRDLLVGDFPGYFWYFENTNSDDEPKYTSRGKLKAGGEAAKTPVY